MQDRESLCREIRRDVRERRRMLDEHTRQRAAESIARRLLHQPVFRHARSIAAYLPVDGEASLLPLIEDAWHLGKKVFLPRLVGDHMEFRRFDADSPLLTNRFFIPEPDPRRSLRRSAEKIDLVLAPLVGFDDAGNRLGMGGGYYDRTFAFLRHRHNYQRPRLIGVAYEWQRATTIPAADWDVPLYAAVTDHAFHEFRRSHK